MEVKEYERIFELVHAALGSSDEDEKDLSMDLVKAAFAYTEERLSWNWLTLEEKDANDAARTRKHDHMIDCFNIFLRYEANFRNTEIIDLGIYDRKAIGDMGNQLIADLAISQR